MDEGKRISAALILVRSANALARFGGGYRNWEGQAQNRNRITAILASEFCWCPYLSFLTIKSRNCGHTLSSKRIQASRWMDPNLSLSAYRRSHGRPAYVGLAIAVVWWVLQTQHSLLRVDGEDAVLIFTRSRNFCESLREEVSKMRDASGTLEPYESMTTAPDRESTRPRAKSKRCKRITRK